MWKRFSRYFLILVIIIIVLARIHLSIVRFFDSDEMSHMHWAWLVSQGKIPYRDFFYYNLPGYQYVIGLLFFLPPSNAILILVRLWQLFMYLATTALLFKITRTVTGSYKTGLLAAVIFLMFPMTFDKTIDIRPDVSMMLLYLLAVDLILKGKPWTTGRLLYLGAVISLSVLITLKTVIFALPALGYLFIFGKLRPTLTQMLIASGGFVAPIFLYFLYLSISGALLPAITMITHDGLEVSAGKSPFSPWKALSPWPLVYIYEGGDSLPWRMNTIIWIFSTLGLGYTWGKNRLAALFLTIFFVCGVAFLFLFPAPYLQYFIPLSVFASLLCAYFLRNLLRDVGSKLEKDRQSRKNGRCRDFVITLMVSFWLQYRERVTDHASNAEQLGVITSVLSMSKPDETFYDMVGSYIFRPDGYALCCHPYAEFVDRLSTKLPTLRESLVANKTKFVVMDRTAVVFWQPKPDDLTFLRTHYLVSSKNWKIYLHGYSFGCTGGQCKRYDIDNNPVPDHSEQSFDIIAPDTYKATILPTAATITIDGTVHGNLSKIFMEEGKHQFSVDDQVTSWSIQLDR